MAERAVFLDRDGTIIEDSAYLGDPAKVKLLAGSATALSAIRALGYRLIVVSNQSGVARGMFDEAAVEAVNDEMSRQLKQQAGAYVDASYYCPYHPEAVVAAYRADHEWRKPKPGMIKQAAADFGLDLSQSWMIGDMARDIAAGAAAGCRTILLKDAEKRGGGGAGGKVNGGEGTTEASPNFVVRSLADAARIILREGRTQQVHLPIETAVEETPAAKVLGEEGRTLAAARVEERASKDLEKVTPVVEKVSNTGGGNAATASGAALEQRVAERVARSIPVRLNAGGTGGDGISSQVEKNLDELVLQLRAQNRNLELKPDFSLPHIGAMILQAAAVVALVMGLANHFTARATFADSTTIKGLSDQYFAMMAHEQSVFWGAVAVVFQGMVIALLVFARGR